MELSSVNLTVPTIENHPARYCEMESSPLPVDPDKIGFKENIVPASAQDAKSKTDTQALEPPPLITTDVIDPSVPSKSSNSKEQILLPYPTTNLQGGFIFPVSPSQSTVPYVSAWKAPENASLYPAIPMPAPPASPSEATPASGASAVTYPRTPIEAYCKYCKKTAMTEVTAHIRLRAYVYSFILCVPAILFCSLGRCLAPLSRYRKISHKCSLCQSYLGSYKLPEKIALENKCCWGCGCCASFGGTCLCAKDTVECCAQFGECFVDVVEVAV